MRRHSQTRRGRLGAAPHRPPFFRGEARHGGQAVQILLVIYMGSAFISYFLGDVKGLSVWIYLYRFGNEIERMFEAKDSRAQSQNPHPFKNRRDAAPASAVRGV